MAQVKVSASLVNASAVVTVQGEDLSTLVQQNHIMVVTDEYVPYFVADTEYSTIDQATYVTLSAPYAGTTGIYDVAFVVDFTEPDQIPTIFPGDIGTATIFTQAMYKIQELIAAVDPEGFSAILDARDAAIAAAAAAEDSAELAENHSTTAQAADFSAGQYAAKAQDWAEKTDGAVEPGKFSAKYWADLAQGAMAGTIVYRGVWDASTAAYPVTPVAGDYYKISVAGTISGNVYAVNDSIIYNGTTWDKIDSTDAVSSVAGRTGAVVLTYADLTGSIQGIVIGNVTPAAAYFTQVYSNDNIRVEGGSPNYLWNETDASANARMWRAIVSSGVMHFQAVNDALSSAFDLFTVTRDGKFNALNHLYRETFTSQTASTGTTTINIGTNSNFVIEMEADTAIAFDGLAPSGCVYYVQIFMRQDATGGRDVTFPAEVHWDDNATPDFPTTPNRTNVVTLVTVDGGTTWIGALGLRNVDM